MQFFCKFETSQYKNLRGKNHQRIKQMGLDWLSTEASWKQSWNIIVWWQWKEWTRGSKTGGHNPPWATWGLSENNPLSLYCHHLSWSVKLLLLGVLWEWPLGLQNNHFQCPIVSGFIDSFSPKFAIFHLDFILFGRRATVVLANCGSWSRTSSPSWPSQWPWLCITQELKSPPYLPSEAGAISIVLQLFCLRKQKEYWHSPLL